MSATLTIFEAARWLGISRGSAYEAARSGEIAGVVILRVGRRILIPRAPFFAALGLDQQTVNETADEDGSG